MTIFLLIYAVLFYLTSVIPFCWEKIRALYTQDEERHLKREEYDLGAIGVRLDL